MTFDEAIATLRYREVRECRDNGNQVILAIAEEVARLRSCIDHISGVKRTDPMMDNAIRKAEEFLAKYRYVDPPVCEGEAPGVHQIPPASDGLYYFQVTESVPCAPNVFVVDATVDSEPTEGDRLMEFFKGDGA